jgi:hypothetical protein
MEVCVTINQKLAVQNIIVAVAVTIISSVFVYTLDSLDRIEKERQIISRLAIKASELSSSINGLDSNQMDGARERFGAAAKDLSDAFASIASVKELPRTNEDLRDAITVLTKLQPLVEQSIAEIEGSTTQLAADLKKYLSSTSSTAVMDFYSNEYVRKKYDLTDVYAHIDGFRTMVVGANSTMRTVSDNIAEQQSIIDGEIAKRRLWGIGVAIALSFVLCLCLIILTRYISKSIRSRVADFQRKLIPIAEGQLTETIADSGKNEISGVAS